VTDTMAQPEEPTAEPTPDTSVPEGVEAPSVGQNEPAMGDTTDMSIMPDKEPKGVGKQIKKIADDYVVPISDHAIEQWTEALKGQDIQVFKDYASQVACGLYPTLAPQISAGIPTQVLLDPYVRTAENILGPIMTEPDWTDAKWSAALQGGLDPKTGRPVPMTLHEWSEYLRQEPGHGWDKSPEAQSRAQMFGQALDQSFGATEQPQ